HDSEGGAFAFARQNIRARRVQPPTRVHHATAMPELSGMPSGVMAGKKCPECGAHAMIRKDGCDYCTSCGHLGSCG
ncbi:MAG TPA: hypothetical protein PKC60_16260, partial [Hydrogenophaga sp.]|uniref:hypothetical protein n=1 Tax=Hydrogenophaga sp. TaxID=1904254 RepID=UPI002C64EFD0